MTDTIRYGIVGCGMMGQEHIRNIALLEGASVSAIAEPDDAMRAEAAALVPGVRAESSLDALLGSDDVDAIVIAAPNHLHVDMLDRLATARPVPVLVEKPLFTDGSDQDRLQKLKSDYPAMMWVAMEYRYMPPIAAFLERAHEVTGGLQMLTIREHRFPFLEKVGDWNRFNRNTGGTMVEKCCHFFDLMRLALGSEPVRVMASAGQAVNHLDESYANEVPDIWDHGYVIVDFANGTRGMLELCMFADGSRYQEELSGVGPDGKIEAMVPGPVRFWPESLGPLPTPKVIISPRDRQTHAPMDLEFPVDPALLEIGDHNGATFYQHQLFLKALKNGGVPAVSLDDGAVAVRMGLAAQESARSGKAVLL
ncbi:MAG: Gfo/Idh/MocA family oxidoreductase [Pseudomonadota bacterium]